MDPREQFDKIALNCITYLETFEECRNVNFQCGDGAASHESVLWEKRNSPYKLPTDLKNFYCMFNGVQLGWNVDLNEKSVQVGYIRVNRLESLKAVDVLGAFDSNAWSDATSSSDTPSPPDPRTCAAFSLDSQCEFGEVVLLYRNDPDYSTNTTSTIATTAAAVAGSADDSDGHAGSEAVGISSQEEQRLHQPEVWFIDRSSRWFFLSKNFTQYFRLLIIHLGIHGWQLAFTPEGLPTTAQHWMGMFCKERLIIDRYWRERLILRGK
mmetsp:Transcript_2419/g.3788  ORF Transcript_2419/g.3788 Transcript_2419/m.3788 type:complete len:267 (-) Transcript_2419:4016-4816(-)